MAQEAGAERRFTILLLTEDDRVIRRVRRLLEPADYTVVVHHSGRAGLEALESGLFSMCMVDQDLMDISGFEVVGQGKEASPGTEFVMLFEYPNISKALLALTYGAYGYLAKPLDDPGAVLTKVILAREKISLNLQLKTLMNEFDLQQRRDLQVAPVEDGEALWETEATEELG